MTQDNQEHSEGKLKEAIADSAITSFISTVGFTMDINYYDYNSLRPE